MRTMSMTREQNITAIIERDGPGCFFPGCEKPLKREDITLDHWIPQSKGGTWALKNLRIMHKRCNALKGDRMPNPDGTLPSLKREANLNERRAVRENRPVVCPVCDSGRKLGPDERCGTCGSEAMPKVYPHWAKVRADECPHEGPWWCWACSIGITPRAQPAFVYVLNGDDDSEFDT